MGFIVVQWENENCASGVNEEQVVGAVKLKVWRTVIDWPVGQAAIYKAMILKVCGEYKLRYLVHKTETTTHYGQQFTGNRHTPTDY